MARPCCAGRIDVEQHRLRQRHQRRAEEPLQHAEQHDLIERLRHAAQRRGQGEADDRHQEQRLAAEAVGQPAGERRHDRRGHDVGGQHPGHLVLRRRQAALHARQRHVGDGGVERLQDRGQHHGDGDHAAMQRHAVSAGLHGARHQRRAGCRAAAAEQTAPVPRIDRHLGAQARMQR